MYSILKGLSCHQCLSSAFHQIDANIKAASIQIVQDTPVEMLLGCEVSSVQGIEPEATACKESKAVKAATLGASSSTVAFSYLS